MSFLSQADNRNLEIFRLKLILITTETKRSTKEFLTDSTNFNLLTGTLLFGFPIIFYLSCLGETKQKELNTFIETTVPGLANQKNKISWETFQKTAYFPVPQNSTNISLKTIDNNKFQESIYQNSIANLEIWGQSLNFEVKDTWKSYKKQYFLGTRLQSRNLESKKYFIYPSRERLDSPFYKNIYSKQTPNFNNLKFYQLDEYPFKVENIYKNPNLNKLPIQLKKISLEVIDNNKSLENFSFKKEKRIQSDIIAIKSILKSTNLIKNNKSNLGPVKSEIFSTFKIFKQSQVKWQKVTIKIRELQSQTNYNLPVQLTNLVNQDSIKLIPTNYNALASHQLLNLLENSYSTPINSESGHFDRPPLMSGFSYPDLTKNAILNFNFSRPNVLFNQSLINFDKQIQIYLGPHFVFPEFHWNKKTDPLPFHFHDSPTCFKLINGKIAYKGPGVRFNDTYNTNVPLNENYFDRNSTNLKTILNQPDPRLNQPFYSFSKLLNEIKTKNELGDQVTPTYQNAKNLTLLKNYFFLKPLLQERFSTNPTFNYQSQFVVPYLKSTDWGEWAAKKTSTSKNQTGLIQSFPIRKVQSITNSNSKFIYDSMDYQNPNWVFNFLRTKIVNYDDLVTQSPFSKSISIGKYQNIFYQKKRDVYGFEKDQSNNIQKNLNQLNEIVRVEPKVFREVWEPIHQNSWLTINKFLFALLIVYILRQFIREYGKELVSYLVDLFASIGIVDDSLKEELAPQTLTKTYRLIKKTQKDFKNITGINHIFPDVAEIVWFLRNLGRPFQLGNLVPKGLLLVGSPGTGKTLLVQAIAGEAEVPVLVQSASTLHRLEGRGPQKLKSLFEKARELGPCIIFFDELDSIGEKRSKIIENPVDQTTLLSLLYWNRKEKNITYDYGIPFTKKKFNFSTTKKLTKTQTDETTLLGSPTSQEQSPEQLGLLMQLLIELDGLQINRNLVVIGATNRPEILDPALIRPGRLSKILEIGLPNKESRVSICQLYSQFLGVSTSICWETIAEETTGLSGADLATIMNQSAIQAILLGTKHTQETIYVAIDKVLGSGSSPYNSSQSVFDVLLNSTSPSQTYDLQKHFLISSAYNEAGLKVVEYCLPNYKKPIEARLISPIKNSRYKNQDLDYFIKTQELTTQYKIQFRTKIISFLSGKAAQFLFLRRSKLTQWNQLQTLLNLGTSQLQNASSLIYFTISKESFFPTYLPSVNFDLRNNQNQSEHIDQDMIDLFTNLAGKYEKDLLAIEFSKYRTFQRWTTKSWWQVQVSNLDKLRNTKKASWYRLFVMHPDNSTPSDERLSADTYFHNNNCYFLSRTLSFNGQFEQRRDLLYKNILDNSFNLTLLLLNENRELLDLFVSLLIQKQILNQTDLNNLFKNFNFPRYKLTKNKTKINYTNQLKENKIFFF